MRLLLVLALAALALTACGSLRPPGAEPAARPGVAIAPQDEVPAAAEEAPAAVEEAPADEGRGVVGGILMYLPNRVIDLFDVAKLGVDVGPGLGIELKATEYAQLMALSTFAVGVGFQGLRHLPFRVGPEAAFGVGPLGGAAEIGGWYRGPTEFRVGLHALLVGAHASVDPVEIVDFVLGFLLIDIKDDDL